MLDRQAQIRPTRGQSSGERHKRPGPVKSPPTRDAPDERNGLATCSQSVPRQTAQMATPLATNIPSVAPVTNPIAQHHHLGISFHHAIRGSLARFNSCITTRLCHLSRHRNLIYAQGPSHKGGTAFNSPGRPGLQLCFCHRPARPGDPVIAGVALVPTSRAQWLLDSRFRGNDSEEAGPLLSSWPGLARPPRFLDGESANRGCPALRPGMTEFEFTVLAPNSRGCRSRRA